jgi:hypothetical protein
MSKIKTFLERKINNFNKFIQRLQIRFYFVAEKSAEKRHFIKFIGGCYPKVMRMQ